MAKKKEKIPDVQGELIVQLISKNAEPQALFDIAGLHDMLKKRLKQKLMTTWVIRSILL